MGRIITPVHTASIVTSLNEFTPDEIELLYGEMSPDEQQEFDTLLKTAPPRALMPHQYVPIHLGWWEVYVLVGGRGVGKTVTGAYAVRDHCKIFKKKARVGIGAPTNADVRDTCLEGETGLITMFPHEFVDYNRSLGEARHIDGGIIKAMGTEKPKRWNGPQWSMLWFDELALCNQAAWDDANMGLRLGDRPYAVCTTTPKNRKWVKNLCLERTTYVPQYLDPDTGKRRLPTTFDNKFLPPRRVEWLRNKYGGTRLGRQELDGLFIDDIEGAKWNRRMIIHETDNSLWPKFMKIYVAIDPAGSRTRRTADQNALSEDDRQNQRKNADTAIAVVGLGTDSKFYVLYVKSGQWSPTEWATIAIECYHKFNGDKIVAEKNYGGEMVESTIRGVNVMSKELGRQLVGKYLPVTLVTASKGKDIRAEPVSSLYEQHKVIHTRYFAEAEDQMCAFVDADDNEGADMVDAIVWAITELAGLSMGDSRIYIAPQDQRLTFMNFKW